MDESIREFRLHHGLDPAIVVRSPESIVLLGDFITENDGLALAVAGDRYIKILAAPGGDKTLNIHAIGPDQKLPINLETLEQDGSGDFTHLPDWALRLAGIALALHQAGIKLNGAAVSILANLSTHKGSTAFNSAIEAGFVILLDHLSGAVIDRVKMAQLCQSVDREFGDNPNHLVECKTSLLGEPGCALVIDLPSEKFIPVMFPMQYTIVIAEPEMQSITDPANLQTLRQAHIQSVQLLRQYKPEINSLLDIQATEFMAYAPYLPAEIRASAEHRVKENTRISSAQNALQRDDIEAFGALLYASHASLRDLYHVSSPELDTLVTLSREIEGCFGARMIDTLAGRRTLNIVDTDRLDTFIAQLSDSYFAHTGTDLKTYTCQPGRGAFIEALQD